MSTRATVWILNEDNGDERFLYHHCDGYMLDEEINPILTNLQDDKWTVDGVAEAIINYDEAYGRHKVDGVGWDSEYVYKISVDKKTIEKFECGINDTDAGDRKYEKTQAKYLKTKYGFSKFTIDDDATKSQIIKIQLLDMIKYACKCIEDGVPAIEYDKIGKIFKIIHDES